MWSVPPPTLQEAKERYESDSIDYTSKVRTTLEKLSDAHGDKLVLHTFPGQIEYPAIAWPVREWFETAKGVTKTTTYLLDALHIARLVKDNYEIELIREANRISSGAHETLMRELGKAAGRRDTQGGGEGKMRERSGKESLGEWEVESEGDAEALFVATCRRAG